MVKEQNEQDLLFRQSRDLDHVWQPVRYLVLLHEEVADLLEAQSLVLRYRDVLDCVVLDGLLAAIDQVLEEEDCDALVRW